MVCCFPTLVPSFDDGCAMGCWVHRSCPARCCGCCCTSPLPPPPSLLPACCFVASQKMGAPELSNAVLEHLPPKDAANALLLMNELAAEQEAKAQQEQRAKEAADAAAATAAAEAAAAAGPGGQDAASGQGKAADGAAASGATKQGGDGKASAAGAAAAAALGGTALLTMEQGAANNIMEHIGLKDKAGLLASLDPSKVRRSCAGTKGSRCNAAAALKSGPVRRCRGWAMGVMERHPPTQPFAERVLCPLT